MPPERQNLQFTLDFPTKTGKICTEGEYKVSQLSKNPSGMPHRNAPENSTRTISWASFALSGSH